jgi:hypothetical protein
VIDTLIGQYGNDRLSMAAVQAMAATMRNWQMPSASFGFFSVLAMNEPMLLPMPRPVRKTARMIENV